MENEHVYTNSANGYPLGQGFALIHKVRLPHFDWYTADLCFFRLGDVTINNKLEVKYSNGYTKAYALKIFKGTNWLRDVIIEQLRKKYVPVQWPKAWRKHQKCAKYIV